MEDTLKVDSDIHWLLVDLYDYHARFWEELFLPFPLIGVNEKLLGTISLIIVFSSISL